MTSLLFDRSTAREVGFVETHHVRSTVRFVRHGPTGWKVARNFVFRQSLDLDHAQFAINRLDRLDVDPVEIPAGSG